MSASHPIPARGETTPTDEPPTLRSLWGKYPGLERADDDAELLAQIAALTSENARLQKNWDEAYEVHESDKIEIIDLRAEVSALREAVDALIASGYSGPHYLGVSADKFHALKDLRAARRDGAP